MVGRPQAVSDEDILQAIITMEDFFVDENGVFVRPQWNCPKFEEIATKLDYKMSSSAALKQPSMFDGPDDILFTTECGQNITSNLRYLAPRMTDEEIEWLFKCWEANQPEPPQFCVLCSAVVKQILQFSTGQKSTTDAFDTFISKLERYNIIFPF
jgi:hypothetical protein